MRSFLDEHRVTFRRKTDGLDTAQLRQRLAPSSLSLGGLAKHLAFVEDFWFGYVLTGAEPAAEFAAADWDADPDWEFTSADDEEAAALLDLWSRTVMRSEANLDACGGLDDLAARRHHRDDAPLTVRWMLLHMISEYARHNGHADLVRESIDGRTGY
nr:DinB family protein [Nocardioides flavescens]